MKKTEFYQAVQNDIKGFLPESFIAYDLSLRKVNASYGEYMGLSVGMFGKSIEPTFNLDHMYSLVKDCPMSEALQKTADVVSEYYDNIPDYMQDITSRSVEITREFESAKPYMFAAPCAIGNKGFMENAPYRMIEEIALIAKIDLNPEDMEKSVTIPINNSLMESWGVSVDEILDHAIDNTKEIRPGKMKSLASILKDDYGLDDMLLPPDEGPNIYVYTNEKKNDGFAGLFSKGETQEIYEKLGDDFYILPSSRHEALLVPECGNRGYLDAKTYSDMVAEVNRTQVEPEDVISDFAYHYDHAADKFEKAYDFAKRIEKEQSMEQDILPEKVTMTMKVDAMEKQII